MTTAAPTLSRARRCAAVVAVCLAGLALLTGAATARGIDGPGSYYMFRSFDTGAAFTAGQAKACADHYGPVRGATVSRLNAALFAFAGDPLTGRVVNQKAAYLSPAIACTAPATSPDLLELFGVMWPPPSVVAGLSTFDTLCSPTPAIAQPGALLVNCRDPFGPDPAGRVVGGFATSNSVSNPRNAVPGAPTGSIWTTYVVARRGARIPAPSGGTPPSTPDPSAGLQFYVLRTSRDALSTSSPDCPTAAPITVTGARASPLYAASPRPVDGKLPPRLGQRAGALTLCFTSATQNARRSATGRILLSYRGGTIQLDASGDCRDYPTAAEPRLLQQACNLTVAPSPAQLLAGVRGGLLTSIGLVDSDRPLGAANSHVWTLALFANAG